MGKYKNKNRNYKKPPKYPVPKLCPYCKGEVKYGSNSVLYGGKEYGNGKCYYCVECHASVGVHPDLKTPLGRLANKELKNLKQVAHSLFDPLWKSGKMKRQVAYNKLASKLSFPAHECHFGWFDKDMLIKAIGILKTGI